MIKYTTSQVVFEEIPDEITLAVNISNCTHNCVGCHSPELRKDIGSLRNFKAVDELLAKNSGVTCFLLLGEGNDAESLKELISYIKEKYPELKVGLYSGREKVNENFYWDKLDYLKIGPYIKELGPLNSPTTNQILWKHDRAIVNPNFSWINITDKFWKKEEGSA